MRESVPSRPPDTQTAPPTAAMPTPPARVETMRRAGGRLDGSARQTAPATGSVTQTAPSA